MFILGNVLSVHKGWGSSKAYRPTDTSGGSKGGREERAPPPGLKFLHFHAVFGKNWPNNRLAPPPWAWRPLLWEILDPPLDTMVTR